MKQRGFSLMEMMLTLMFVGILVVSTIPAVVNSQTGKLALVRTKNVASLIQTATEQYKTTLEAPAPSSTVEVVSLTDQTKYLTKITSGSLLTSGESCGNPYPCYRYADGSVLLPTEAAFLNGRVAYQYDPDGTGNVPSVTLILDYERTRVASLAAFTGNPDDDPAYTQPWTQL